MAYNHGMNFYRKIHGFMGDEDRMAIQSAILDTSAVPGQLLEIGNLDGLSAIMSLAVMAKGKKLVLCDVVHSKALIETLQYYHATSLVELFARGFDAYAETRPGPFSHIFIDHDHHYESTRRAIRLFWPLLSPRGIMSLHDYGHPECPGVKQAVHEFEAETTDYEVVYRGFTCCFRKRSTDSAAVGMRLPK